MLKGISIKSRVIPLPQAFMDYMNEESIFLPYVVVVVMEGWCGGGLMWWRVGVVEGDVVEGDVVEGDVMEEGWRWREMWSSMVWCEE